MKRPDNKLEELGWIEQYVQRKMTSEESRDIENEIRNDNEFALEVEHFRQTYLRIEEAFLEESALDTIRSLQARDRKNEKTIHIFRYFSVAASLSLLFIAYLSLSMPEFPDSENDFTVVRSANATSMSANQRAVFDQFFEGQAHIVEGQYVMAVRNFEKVLESNDLRPYFREAAQWHLIVAYMKSGDISRAQQLYKNFDDCMDCEYQVSRVNRWKIWWQLNLKKLV